MTREEAIKYAEAMKAEVQERIEFFRLGHTHAPEVHYSDLAFLSAAISALREQEERRWIPVTERLPENETDVLVAYTRKGVRGCSYSGVCTAFHTDGRTRTENSSYDWEIDMDYNEEVDAYIVPEGWWETVDFGEEFFAVDAVVTHWMPLPEPPKEGRYE